MNAKSTRLTPEQQLLLDLRLKRQHSVPALKQDASFKAAAAPVANRLRLTPGQRELWVLAQLSEESLRAYNETFSLRFRGRFHMKALGDALVSLTDRHESLRTSFDSTGEYLHIHSKIGIDLPLTDLSHLAADEQQGALAVELLSQARAPFDLHRVPLLRARIIRLGDNDHVVSLTMHHIITDGASNGVILSDLRALYSANVEGRASELPKVTQLTSLVPAASQTDDALEEFWGAEYSDGFPGLELPADRARPAAQTFAGAQTYQKISEVLFGEITRVAQANNVTLLGMLLATFRLLMHRLSRQPDLVVGTLSAGQLWDGAAGRSVGYFVNLLPLRSRPDEHQSFLSYMDSTYTQLLDATEHQGYPISLLTERLKLRRDSSKSPLIPCVFNFVRSASSLRFDLAGAELELRRVHNGYSRFDVSINAIQRGDGLSLEWEYNTDLFEEKTIRRWMQHFETLLGEVAAKPNLPLWRFQVLSDAELRQVLVDWNKSLHVDNVHCVHELFESQAATRPDSVALVSDDAQLTYGELRDRSGKLANTLRAFGVGPETVVGVAVKRSTEMVVAVLGVLKAGGAYLPLDLSFPEERLSFMLRDAKARLIVTEPGAALPQVDEAVLAAEGGLVVRGQASPSRFDPHEADPSNLAYVIYTSGSTGKPKGVMISHASILNRLLWMKEAYGWGSEDSALQKTPLIFDASIWELFVPLLSGGRVILARPEGQQDPGYMAQRIADEGISILQLVPSSLGAFLQHGRAAVSKLRHLFCGGEAFPSALAGLAEEQLGVRITNLYGPTEASIDVTSWDFAPPTTRALLPIGRPISNTSVYVLDQNLLPAPIGVSGELYASGPGLARGYHGRRDQTAEKFIPNPYAGSSGTRMYRTGDIARWLPDGVIEFVGRADTQVKVRGFRIELGEIEGALSRQQGVEAAAVIHWKDAENHDQLVGYVVPRQGSDVSPGLLRRSLLEELPEYMVPSTFVLLSSIPRTPGGKLDRKALPAPVQENAAVGSLPRTPVEQMVAVIWEEVLHVENVGIHNSFFELGGHSLSVLQLLARVLEVFKVQIPLRRVFDAPTIAELAETITEAITRADAPFKPPLEPAASADSKPLSFSQQRLWFLHRLEPESPAYNLPAVIDLPPDVDLQALERALAAVVQRHEVLRGVFVEADGVAEQRIRAEAEAPINLIDLTGHPETERWDNARRIAVARTSLPFDLAHGPLFRADVLRLGPREHLLLLVLHHIVADNWSIAILKRELDQFYRSFARNETLELPGLRIQYSDYSSWQRSWLQGAALDSQVSYWAERLADAVPIVSLQTDYPRPPMQTYRGALQIAKLPLALTDDLRRLSRRLSVTLFMTLLAAFKVLLVRHGVGDDIIVGSHVANRDHVETETLIGFFINSLVLRTDMSGDPTFEEALARVRETTLGAYAHQDLPFERVVEKVQPRRNLSITPLYQISFDYQKSDDLLVVNKSRPPLLGDSPTAKFDINVTAEERPNGLIIVAEYCTDLYEAATIERLLRHYQVLLENIAQDSSQRVSEIELLDARHRAQIEVHSQGRRASYPIELTIGRHFERQAKQTPDRVAATAGADAITYGELNREANRLAWLLVEGGFVPGQFAAVLVPRGLRFLAAILGILKAGGAYVPVDPDYPDARVEYMIRNCGASALLTEASLATSFSSVLAESRALRQIVCLDSRDDTDFFEADARYFTWKDFSAFSGEDLAVAYDPRDLAYVLYTSGSTGNPKAAIVRHDGAVNHIFAQIDELALEDGFTFLQSAPCSSDISVWQMLAPVLAGGKTVTVDSMVVSDQERLFEILKVEQISIAEFVPAVLKCLLDYLDGVPRVARELPALRCMMVTGEEVPVVLMNRWLAAYPRVPLVNAYGPTEASDDVTQMIATDQLNQPGKIASIGKPLPNVDCYILDGNLQLVPFGVPGELCVGGIAVGEGYWGAARQTSVSFVPDPFSVSGKRLYRTGDLCRWTSGGVIEFLGRIDRQVKVRGYRIELGEVEAALDAVEGIVDCAAVVRDEGDEKQLVAYLVAQNGAAPKPRELRELLCRKLPEHMVPSAFSILDALPLTPGGKVDKKALAEIRPSALAREVVPLTTAKQRMLAAIWSEVLHVDVEPFGAQADFFELGGHSLLGTLVISRVRERAGIELPLRRIFEYSTIEGLAAQLDASEPAHPAASIPAMTRSARELRRVPAQAVDISR